MGANPIFKINISSKETFFDGAFIEKRKKLSKASWKN